MFEKTAVDFKCTCSGKAKTINVVQMCKDRDMS